MARRVFEVWVTKEDGTEIIVGEKHDDPAVIGMEVNYAIRTWKNFRGITVIPYDILDKDEKPKRKKA